MPEKNMVKHSNLVDSYNRNSIMDDIDSLQIQNKYYQTEKFSKKQVCYAGKNGKKWKQFCELHYSGYHHTEIGMKVHISTDLQQIML